MSKEKSLVEKFLEYANQFPPNFEGMEEVINNGLSINEYDQTSCGVFTLFSSVFTNYCANWKNDHMACLFCDNVEREIDRCQICPYGFWVGRNGKYLPQIASFFLEHGFDVSLCNGEFGFWSLIDAVQSSFDKYAIEVVKLLLEAGANPHCCNADESITSYIQKYIEEKIEDEESEEAFILKNLLNIIDEYSKNNIFPREECNTCRLKNETNLKTDLICDGVVVHYKRGKRTSYGNLIRERDSKLLKKNNSL